MIYFIENSEVESIPSENISVLEHPEDIMLKPFNEWPIDSIFLLIITLILFTNFCLSLMGVKK